ncbi:MAG: hypothetical protein IJ703_11330 [Eubacterium sp.]|nr:hypothetical protein [Eubacterium sp.]
MKNKKGTIVMLVALVLVFVALILPFQEVPAELKGLMTINKPIGTIAGIGALACGVLALLATAIGKKKATLILGFISAALVFIIIFANKSHKFFGMKVEVDNKIGYTMCWVAAFVMAIATLFAYLTTPRYEKRK